MHDNQLTPKPEATIMPVPELPPNMHEYEAVADKTRALESAH